MWTLVAMTGTWATLAAMAYHTGLQEADEIGDGQLAAWAQLWMELPQLPAFPTQPAPARPPAPPRSPTRRSGPGSPSYPTRMPT